MGCKVFTPLLSVYNVHALWDVVWSKSVLFLAFIYFYNYAKIENLNAEDIENEEKVAVVLMFLKITFRKDLIYCSSERLGTTHIYEQAWLVPNCLANPDNITIYATNDLIVRLELTLLEKSGLELFQFNMWFLMFVGTVPVQHNNCFLVSDIFSFICNVAKAPGMISTFYSKH